MLTSLCTNSVNQQITTKSYSRVLIIEHLLNSYLRVGLSVTVQRLEESVNVEPMIGVAEPKDTVSESVGGLKEQHNTVIDINAE